LRPKGQITLPTEVRESLNLSDGDVVEFVIEGGGVTMRPLRLIPADQAWFWTESWQRGEREADEDLRAGRFERHVDDETFLKALSD